MNNFTDDETLILSSLNSTALKRRINDLCAEAAKIAGIPAGSVLGDSRDQRSVRVRDVVIYRLASEGVSLRSIDRAWGSGSGTASSAYKREKARRGEA